MKKPIALLLFVLTAGILFSSCQKDGDKYPDFSRLISAGNITVMPDPLEAIGGKVPMTIHIDVPAYFTKPTATVTLTPYIVWNGGEVRGQHGGFQGEQCVDMGGNVIPYKEGGKVTMKASFDYLPEMAGSKLYLEFGVTYDGLTSTFRIPLCDGVISTI